MLKELINKLKKLGLTSNQSKTYISMLKLGKGTVIRISNEADIARTTVYDNIKTLKEMGLANEIWEKGKKYYKAEHPKNLINLIKTKKSIIDRIIPQLSILTQDSSSETRITVFKGEIGYKKQHEESLNLYKKRRTRFIGNVSSIFSWLSKEYVKNYIRQRIKKGIKNEVLTSKQILKHKKMYSKKRNRESLREIRFLTNAEKIKTGLFGFDNIVYISPSNKEDYVIKIESDEFADSFNTIFDTLWKNAQEL